MQRRCRLYPSLALRSCATEPTARTPHQSSRVRVYSPLAPARSTGPPPTPALLGFQLFPRILGPSRGNAEVAPMMRSRHATPAMCVPLLPEEDGGRSPCHAHSHPPPPPLPCPLPPPLASQANPCSPASLLPAAARAPLLAVRAWTDGSVDLARGAPGWRWWQRWLVVRRRREGGKKTKAAALCAALLLL
ncbi:hypothetical protein SEVIR_5G260150v4 [Setaria viridis]